MSRLICLAATMLLAGYACAPASNEPSIDFLAQIRGETLTVAGTTDLPDGTILTLKFDHDTLIQTIPNIDTQVIDGGFEHMITTAGWPRGRVTVYVVFVPGLWQPREAQDRFGPEGENLRGPNVIDDSGSPTLRLTQQLDVG